MLCRSENHIKLPRREDLIMHLKFSDQEVRVYRRANEKVFRRIEDALGLEQPRGCYRYRNVLQKIEGLRQVCTLGPSNVEDATKNAFAQLQVIPTSQLTPDTALFAIRLFSPSLPLGLPLVCVKCNTLMAFASESPDKSSWVHFTSCHCL